MKKEIDSIYLESRELKHINVMTKEQPTIEIKHMQKYSPTFTYLKLK